MKRTATLIAILCFAFGCRQAQRPQLSLSTYNYDFGVVDSAMQYSGSVTLLNCGNANLQIEKVITGCGCTSAQCSVNTLAPGETGVLRFTYDTKDKTGEQNQFITIIANTDSLVHIFRLSAIVENQI